MDLSSVLRSAGNNAGANFAGAGLTLTLNPTTVTVFSAQEIQLDYQLSTAAAKTDDPIFMVYFPADWTWSTDRT